MAILYSVVFIICTLRLAPYLLVGKNEEMEVRKKLTFDQNNQVVDEEDNEISVPKNSSLNASNDDELSYKKQPLMASRDDMVEDDDRINIQQEERTNMYNHMWNQFRKIKLQ